MQHLKMQTPDIADANIEKIAALFPNCVTERKNAEGKVVRAIDFDQLRQELSKDIVEGPEERYQFTWPDKRKAMREANRPTNKALRPCREESEDFDHTQNLYIEGDNLEVLKCLRETYLGKVKMIYIDPPYNTGNEFVYNDDFKVGSPEWELMNNRDAEGNKLPANTDSNGRFHTDWLNMIYPRLKVARDLLSDDGVVFISIDDNEVNNLRKLSTEIFGENNFVAEMVWQGGKVNTARFISTSHEYILVFAKDLKYCADKNVVWKEHKKGLAPIYEKVESLLRLYSDNNIATEKLKEWFKKEAPEQSKAHEHYCYIDRKGAYCMDNVSRVGGGKYTVVNPINGLIIQPPSRGWVYGKESDFWNAVSEGTIEFLDNDKLPIFKRYLKDNELQLLDTVFYKDRRGAKIRLRNLLGGEYFDFPKDEEVLINIISAFSTKDSLILDFFSGSATTAHAVMQLNAKDGGNRKFIMVQLPEPTDEKSEAYKAGYKNICEIGKERIRRAGKKIKAEHPDAKDLDTGFRVLKLDSSNMKDVFYTPGEVTQQDIFDSVDNIKADRTGEDLLFQVMLECNIPLSAKIATEQLATADGKGATLFNVNDGYLMACFDRDLTEETVTAIAKRKPYYFIMRDAGLANDNIADNFDQIFQYYSKETIRIVI